MAPTALDRRLAALDRDQLLALVRRLLSHQPDLEALVHLPLAGERHPVDAEAVRDRVLGILLGMGDDWRASSRAETELYPIVRMGTDYAEAGALSDARRVYRAILDAILAVYEQIRDEESEIVHVVEDCIEGLGRCLDHTSDPEGRALLLGDVFHVFRWDSIDRGSYGMNERAEAVLRSRATAEERRMLVRWLRDAIPTGEGDGARWGRQRAGELILVLLGDRPDPGELEAVVSAAGLTTQHVDLLLAQGRVDEAVALLSTADRDLPTVADRLVAAGREAEVIARLRRHPRLLETRTDQVRVWLAKHGVDVRALDELAWLCASFGRGPTISRWKELRTDARNTDWWPQVAEAAAEAVAHRGPGNGPVRARALAAAGRWTEAMAVFAALPDSARTNAAVEMGGYAEAERPELAAELYAVAIARLRGMKLRSARAEAEELQARIAGLARSKEV